MKPTTVLPSKLIYHPETGVDLWCRKSYICNCSFSKMKKWKKIIPKPAIITAYGVYWLIRVCCLAGLALFSFKKQIRSLSLMALIVVLQATKGVVVVQHGLTGASDDFLINLIPGSLGFVLADAGYDVWLSNSRGNVYSMTHKKYNPSQDEFWDWRYLCRVRYEIVRFEFGIH